MARRSREERLDAILVDVLRRFSEREGAVRRDPLVMKPLRWWDAGKWRCHNDHVTAVAVDGACGVCGAMAVLTFPEDTDGPVLPAAYAVPGLA